MYFVYLLLYEIKNLITYAHKNMRFNIQRNKYLKTVRFRSHWVLSVAPALQALEVKVPLALEVKADNR